MGKPHSSDELKRDAVAKVTERGYVRRRPRVTNSSASAASTSSLRSPRATGEARHSLLASSTIDRMRNLRPSCVRPSTKS